MHFYYDLVLGLQYFFSENSFFRINVENLPEIKNIDEYLDLIQKRGIILVNSAKAYIFEPTNAIYTNA
jgi:hypothetical protein